MDSMKIYLSGGMSGLTSDEQRKWRKQVMDALKYGDIDTNKHLTFFNPPDYYNFETISHKSEKEPFEFDLYQLRTSDLVIVNFNKPNSIGTAMELMLAKELHIPIIGLNKDGVELHPWLIECCTRMCTDMRELINHVAEFYLS